MPGTSLAHNNIAGNAYILLKMAFRGKNCSAQIESIRLRVSPTHYRYPDVMALCGEWRTDGEKPASVLNPALIVEVLSPSTADEDREDKWSEYRLIPTLTDYLLIAQDRLSVIHYAKQNSRQWTINEYTEPSETLVLGSLEVTLPLASIYEGIVLPNTTLALTEGVASANSG